MTGMKLARSLSGTPFFIPEMIMPRMRSRGVLQHRQLVQHDTGGLAEVGWRRFIQAPVGFCEAREKPEHQHRHFARGGVGQHHLLPGEVFFLQAGKLLRERRWRTASKELPLIQELQRGSLRRSCA